MYVILKRRMCSVCGKGPESEGWSRPGGGGGGGRAGGGAGGGGGGGGGGCTCTQISARGGPCGGEMRWELEAGTRLVRFRLDLVPVWNRMRIRSDLVPVWNRMRIRLDLVPVWNRMRII